MKRIHCSGSLSSDGQVVSAPCWWIGSVLRTNGAADATLDLYDGTSTGDKLIFPDYVTGNLNIGGLIFGTHMGLWCETGIYMDISGTGAYCVIYYSYE